MLTSHQLVLESMGAGFSGSNSGGAGPSYARPDGAGLGRAETSGRPGVDNSYLHLRNWYRCREKLSLIRSGSRNRSRDWLGPTHPYPGNWNGYREQLGPSPRN